jgi:hypothetical protein
MYFRRLVSSNCREQKKVARNMFCASLFVSSISKCHATVQAMVDLPDPASPANQKIRGVFEDESCAHWYMRSSMATRVPRVHGSRVNVFESSTSALYRALRARGKFSS